MQLTFEKNERIHYSMMTIIAVSGCALREKQEMQFGFFFRWDLFSQKVLSFITGSFFILLRWCNAEGNSGYLPNERRSHYNKEEEGERDRRKGGDGSSAGGV